MLWWWWRLCLSGAPRKPAAGEPVPGGEGLTAASGHPSAWGWRQRGQSAAKLGATLPDCRGQSAMVLLPSAPVAQWWPGRPGEVPGSCRVRRSSVPDLARTPEGRLLAASRRWMYSWLWRGGGFGGRVPGGEGAGEIKKNFWVSMNGPCRVHLWSRTRSFKDGSLLRQRVAPGCLVSHGLAIATPDLLDPYKRKQRLFRQTHR